MSKRNAGPAEGHLSDVTDRPTVELFGLDPHPYNVAVQTAVGERKADKPDQHSVKIVPTMGTRSFDQRDPKGFATIDRIDAIAAQMKRDGFDRSAAVIVYTDGDGKEWLADGFHRVRAAVRAGLANVPCHTFTGSDEQLADFVFSKTLHRDIGGKKGRVAVIEALVEAQGLDEKATKALYLARGMTAKDITARSRIAREAGWLLPAVQKGIITPNQGNLMCTVGVAPHLKPLAGDKGFTFNAETKSAFKTLCTQVEKAGGVKAKDPKGTDGIADGLKAWAKALRSQKTEYDLAGLANQVAEQVRLCEQRITDVAAAERQARAEAKVQAAQAEANAAGPASEDVPSTEAAESVANLKAQAEASEAEANDKDAVDYDRAIADWTEARDKAQVALDECNRLVREHIATIKECNDNIKRLEEQRAA